MRRVGALLLGVLPVWPSAAAAFSCFTPSFDNTYKSAAAIFSGEIIDGMGLTKCGPKKMQFRVIEVFKGKPGEEVYVSSGDACIGGGVYLIKGEKYLLYATGSGSEGFRVRACSGTEHLDHVEDRKWDLLAQKRQQLEALDRAIRLQPDDEQQLLRSKAEHLLYWRDYPEAEEPLRRILALAPEDTWAYLELLHVLFEQRKAKEIWSLHSAADRSISYRNVRAYLRYLSFAVLQLGKGFESVEQLIVEDLHLKNLKPAGRTFEHVRMKDSTITDSDFSRSRFIGGGVTKVRFVSSDFSRSVFKGARLEDVSFSSSDLTGSDFSDATLKGFRTYGSDLAGAKFRGARITGASFGRQDLKDSDFTGAEILNSRIHGSDFRNAVLEGVSLEGSKYDCGTRWPEGFDPVAAGAVIDEDCTIGATTVPAPAPAPGSASNSESLNRDRQPEGGAAGPLPDEKAYPKRERRKVDFHDDDMDAARLKYIDLSGSRFHWADASHVSFLETIMDGVDFTYANLRSATFTATDLRNTSFDYAVMSGITFRRVRGRSVEFTQADLSQAEILRSDLSGASFRKARMRKLRVMDSDLSGADFSDADLSGMTLDARSRVAPLLGTGRERQGKVNWPRRRTSFRNASFAGASLEGADLRGGDLSGANLNGASVLLARYDCTTIWPQGFDAGKGGAALVGEPCARRPYSPPRLRGLALKGRSLEGLNLKDADLRGSDLRGAKLEGSDLSSAKLSGADLTAATFDCTTDWPEGFDPIGAGAILAVTLDETCVARYGPADLENKDLTGLDLFYAPLSKADLRGANLADVALGRADLFKADLSKADLRGADLSSANLNGAIFKDATYDCNTHWPRGFSPETEGATGDRDPCVQKKKPLMAGVRVILDDWRRPFGVEGVVVEGESLPWFSARRRSFTKVTFRGVLLRKAYFSQARLESVAFLKSDLRGANFDHARLKDVDLSGSDLRGASFEGAKFKNVTWNGAIYDCHTKGIPLEPKPCE